MLLLLMLLLRLSWFCVGPESCGMLGCGCNGFAPDSCNSCAMPMQGQDTAPVLRQATGSLRQEAIVSQKLCCDPVAGFA